MCRWLAYSGSPFLIEDILYKPAHSLIAQSLHSTLGAEATNGDGFGIGWYGAGETPGSSAPSSLPGTTATSGSCRARSSHRSSLRISAPRPARRCSRRTAIRFVSAAGSGCTTASSTSSRRSSATSCSRSTPRSTRNIEGSTDSEVFFFLALTLGLEEDPPGAVARAVGLIEETGRRHGVEHPIQMTVATTDGASVWAFRYSSEGDSRSLFYSTDVPDAARGAPDLEVLERVSDESRLIVSEPLRDLPGAWNMVPESSYGVIQAGATNCTRSRRRSRPGRPRSRAPPRAVASDAAVPSRRGRTQQMRSSSWRGVAAAHPADESTSLSSLSAPG